jgi:hypothetical protein
MAYRRELQFGILLLSTGLIFLFVVGILDKAGFWSLTKEKPGAMAGGFCGLLCALAVSNIRWPLRIRQVVICSVGVDHLPKGDRMSTILIIILVVLLLGGGGGYYGYNRYGNNGLGGAIGLVLVVLLILWLLGAFHGPVVTP